MCLFLLLNCLARHRVFQNSQGPCYEDPFSPLFVIVVEALIQMF